MIVSKYMSLEKTERNKFIVKMINQGKTYGQLSKELNLGRSTLHQVYKRDHKKYEESTVRSA